MTARMKELADRAAKALNERSDEALAELLRPYDISIGTNRVEGKLELSRGIALPYAGWGDDLAALPRRKMVLWAGAFAELLNERLSEPRYAENLLTYYWLGSPIGCHAAPYLERVESEEGRSIGSVHHLVPTRNGAVLVGRDGLLAVTKQPPEALLIAYDEVEGAKLDYDESLALQAEGRVLTFKPKVQYEDDPDRKRDFDWRFLLDRIPGLEIHSMYAEKHGVSDEVVAEQKALADPLAAIVHHSKHQGDYQSAADVGLRALEKYPGDIELVDALLTPVAYTKGFELALEVFESIRERVVGRDGVYAGNIIGNALAYYDQQGRSDDALDLVREAWIDEPVALGRLFFHNAACIACQAGDFELAWKALRWAAHFGESSSDLEGEGDFAELRDQDGYDAFLQQVESGQLKKVKGTVFGPGDGEVLLASFRRKPSGQVLYRLIQTGSSKARGLYEQLLRSPHTGEDMLASAFFSLIALGDDEALKLARELHDGVEERAPGFDFFLDAGDIKARVPDTEKLRRDVVSVLGEGADEEW